MRKTALALLFLTAASSLSAQTLVPRQDPKKATWGYALESSEKWNVKPQFDTADPFSEMPNGKYRAFVSKKGKKGLLDEKGKVLGAGIVFEETVPMQGDAMLVTVKGKKGVANYDGVYLVKPEIDMMEPLGKGGFMITVKGKKGILGHDGAYILNPVYKEINTSLDDYFIVNKDGKAALMTRDGKSTLIEPKEFTGLEPFGDLWKVFKGEKVGLYDLGKKIIVVKPEYTDVRTPIIANGMALFPVESGADKWGVLNAEGKTVVKKDYTDIITSESLGALLLYKNNDVKGIYFPGDKKSFKVSGYRAEEFGPLKFVTFSYNKNWTNHYISQLVLPDGTAYNAGKDNIQSIGNGFYYVNVPGFDSPLLDRNGNEILPVMRTAPMIYNRWIMTDTKAVSPYGKVMDYAMTDNLPIVTDDQGTRSLILEDGSLSNFKFDSVRVLKIGDKDYIAAKDGNSWGLYDGNAVILPMEYSDMDLISEDKHLLKIAQDGKYGIYSLDSRKMVLTPTFDSLAAVEGKSSLYYVGQNGKKGLYNSSNNTIVIDPSLGYDDFAYISYGSHDSDMAGMSGYIVSKNGKKGLVSYVDGAYKEVLPTVYDDITKEFISHVTSYYGDYDKYYLRLTKGNSKTLYDAVNRSEFKEGVDCDAKYVSLKGGPGLDIRVSGYSPKVTSVKMVITVYNKNGSVAKAFDGYKVEHTEMLDVNKGFFSYLDRLLFTYDVFPVARFQKKEFYFKIAFYDQNGKAIPFKGKDKFSFYVNR